MWCEFSCSNLSSCTACFSLSHPPPLPPPQKKITILYCTCDINHQGYIGHVLSGMERESKMLSHKKLFLLQCCIQAQELQASSHAHRHVKSVIDSKIQWTIPYSFIRSLTHLFNNACSYYTVRKNKDNLFFKKKKARILIQELYSS